MAVNFWPSNKSLSEHVPTFMVFSDPASLKKDTFDKPGVDMEISAVKQKELIEYLSKNTINIVAPINHLKDLKGMKELKRSRFYGFVDIEFRGWNNIHPAFPRGYTSMTMYKMLAWAIYKEYDNVYIIGMDNTYIRSLYNDHNNQLWNVEEHADGENYLHKLDAYDSMASRLQDLIYLFSDLRKFKKDNIYNIDPYSLVDQFEKKDLVAEFKFKSNKR